MRVGVSIGFFKIFKFLLSHCVNSFSNVRYFSSSSVLVEDSLRSSLLNLSYSNRENFVSSSFVTSSNSSLYLFDISLNSRLNRLISFSSYLTCNYSLLSRFNVSQSVHLQIIIQ